MEAGDATRGRGPAEAVRGPVSAPTSRTHTPTGRRSPPARDPGHHRRARGGEAFVIPSGAISETEAALREENRLLKERLRSTDGDSQQARLSNAKKEREVEQLKGRVAELTAALSASEEELSKLENLKREISNSPLRDNAGQFKTFNFQRYDALIEETGNNVEQLRQALAETNAQLRTLDLSTSIPSSVEARIRDSVLGELRGHFDRLAASFAQELRMTLTAQSQPPPGEEVRVLKAAVQQSVEAGEARFSRIEESLARLASKAKPSQDNDLDILASSDEDGDDDGLDRIEAALAERSSGGDLALQAVLWTRVMAVFHISFLGSSCVVISCIYLFQTFSPSCLLVRSVSVSRR
jgi:hypothetical protein